MFIALMIIRSVCNWLSHKSMFLTNVEDGLSLSLFDSDIDNLHSIISPYFYVDIKQDKWGSRIFWSCHVIGSLKP